MFQRDGQQIATAVGPPAGNGEKGRIFTVLRRWSSRILCRNLKQGPLERGEGSAGLGKGGKGLSSERFPPAFRSFPGFPLQAASSIRYNLLKSYNYISNHEEIIFK